MGFPGTFAASVSVNKQLYRLFADEVPDLPIFLRPWWLDAACGEDAWEVSLARKGTEVHAALPFRRRIISGLVILSQPPLTQFLGPWLIPSGAKKANDLGRQKDLMMALIDDLPRFAHYEQNWSPSALNWLPFYWKGFKQTTRYTYVLDNLQNLDAIWSGMRDNIRSDIRKAEGRSNLRMDTEASLGDVIALIDRTYGRQGKTKPFSTEYMIRLDAVCASQKCRRIFVARDQAGQAHAGVYIVWDQNSAYYLIGGGDPELRSSGATSLCMWEAIKFAATVTRRFDFEGSMNESIERFFRSFGAAQIPYFKVQKTQSFLLRTYLILRGM